MTSPNSTKNGSRSLGGAVNSMAQAKRLVLVHVAYVQVACVGYLVGILVLATAAKLGFEGRVRGEVLFDGLLIAAVDDNDLVGSGKAFFDNVLDNRAIYHKKHFLGLSLRSGQKTAAQASSRNECLHESS